MISQIFFGIVEDRQDPLKMGRCRVRIAGVHTHDQTLLPTSDLPWATCLAPITGGDDSSMIAPKEGTEVAVQFYDYPTNQIPIVIGKVPTIPQEKSVFVDEMPTGAILKDELTPQGRPIPTNDIQATGGQEAVVNVPSTNNEALNAVTTSGYNFGGTTKTGIVSIMSDTNSAVLGTTGALAQFQQNLGQSVPSSADAFTLVSKSLGNSQDALKQFATNLSKDIGSTLPNNLLSGTEKISNVFGDLKSDIADIKTIEDIQKLGIEKAKEIQTLNLKDVKSFVSITDTKDFDGVKNLLKTETENLVDSIAKEAEAFTDKLLETASDFVDVVSESVSDILGSLTALGGATIKGLSDPQSVVSAIGKGFSSSEFAKQNIGNIEAVAKLGAELTSNAFKEVGEGNTPPIFGSFGGANYGGGNPDPDKPTAQNLSNFPSGVERETNWGLPEIDAKSVEKYGFNKNIAQKVIESAKRLAPQWGILTTEAQATFLAILGATSYWALTEEKCDWSVDELCKFYPKSFYGYSTNFAKKYTYWTSQKKQPTSKFFEFVYDPANDGQTIGNSLPTDGSQFYGYGLLKIRGKSVYARYAELVPSEYKSAVEKGVEGLKDNVDACVALSAMIFLDRMRNVPPTAHPQYFYMARRDFASDFVTDDLTAEQWYSHFYGAQTQALFGTTEKIAGNTIIPNSFHGAMQDNPQGGSTNVGFQDPSNKYPLKRERQESTIPRLAKGDIRNSIVSLKEQQRLLGVPVAMGQPSWNQPHSSYGAKYPYNTVKQTESGHVIEYDDTPSKERIHVYHRSGTFEEIDASGTKVSRIVGDGYQIIDRNGFITINGDCSVTVSGNVNIFCRSDANIQVEGTTELKCGGSLNVGVAKDFNLSVQGEMNFWANGGFNFQTAKNGHILTKENLYMSANKDVNITSEQRMFVESKQELDVVSALDMKLRTSADYHLTVTEALRENAKSRSTKIAETIHTESGTSVDTKAGGQIRLQTDSGLDIKSQDSIKIETNDSLNLKSIGDTHIQGKDIHIKADTDLFEQASGDIGLRAGANVGLDGETVNFNSGTAGMAEGADGADSAENSPEALEAIVATKALIHGMIPPRIGSPVYPNIKPIEIPEPIGEAEFSIELPEEGQTSIASMSLQAQQSTDGLSNASSEGIAQATGNIIDPVESPYAKRILSTSVFTSDFRLSEHFTLGMLFDGGFNAKHKLIDQAGLTKQQIVLNLSRLCVNILEPYLTVLPNGINGYGKQWRITSGYRMNAGAKASGGSDHCRGRCCDIQLTSRNKAEHFELVQRLDKLVPYDQLLLEYRGARSVWIHTGFRGQENRKQAFTMVNDRKYSRGFVLMT